MHRTIDSAVWRDEWFTGLTPPARYLFLYLMTNEHTHISGLYLVSKATICEESGMAEKKVNALLKLLKYRVSVESIAKDRYPINDVSHQADMPLDTVLIWVHNMLRHQGKGSKVHSGAARQIATVADTKIARKFLKKYPGIKSYLNHEMKYTLSDPLAEKNYTLSKNTLSGDPAPRDTKPYQAPPDTLSVDTLSDPLASSTDRDVTDVIDASGEDANSILKSSDERDKSSDTGEIRGGDGGEKIHPEVLNKYEVTVEAFWSKITAKQRRTWKESHPKIDTNLQLRKAKSYLYTVQARQKYVRFGKFIFNWLNNAENPSKRVREMRGESPTVDEQIGDVG